MLLIAFIFGLAFGWLLEAASRAWDGAWSSIATHAKAVAILRVWWCICFIGFLIAVYVFVGAHYDVDDSYLPPSLLHAFGLVTGSKQLLSIFGFIFGWFCYAWRKELRTLPQQLSETPVTDPKNEGDTDGTKKDDTAETKTDDTEEIKKTDTTGEKGRPRFWLNSTIIATTLGILAVLALIVMAPEVFSRIESFKVGTVEARFAAASERSVHAASPFVAGTIYARKRIERGARLPELLDHVFAPVEDQLGRDLNSAAKEEAGTRRQSSSLFLKTFAFPLAQVLKCYQEVFPINDNGVLHEAVTVANRWSRAAQGKYDLSIHYEDLATKTRTLIANIGNQLPGKPFREPRPPVFPASVQGCDLRTLTLPTDSDKTIKQNISVILNDGLVISFLADFVAFTQDHETSTEFLETMASDVDRQSHIDKQNSAVGQYHLYSNRALFKSIVRWYPPDSIKSDLGKARSAIDLITRKISASDKDTRLLDAKEYFEAERARMINNRIYFLAIELLEGRRLLPVEIDEIKNSSTELESWIKAQPFPFKQGDVVSIAAMNTERRATLSPSFYDTLAVARVATGLSAKDRSASCRRVSEYLEKAHEGYSELAKGAPAANRENLKLLQSHRNLYESFCAKETSSPVQ